MSVQQEDSWISSHIYPHFRRGKTCVLSIMGLGADVNHEANDLKQLH